MKRFVVFAVLALGCADAEDPATSIDAGRDSSAIVDTAPRDTAFSEGGSDAIFPVEDVGPTGICATPSGTTATASGSYMSTPDVLVDGNISSVWNSGDYSGWIRLKLPKPTLFDRVRIAANALPACDHVYTVKGSTGGTETAIGSATRAVTTEHQWLPAIEVTRGTYDEVLVEVAPTASWIALGEIVLFDSLAGCSAP